LSINRPFLVCLWLFEEPSKTMPEISDKKYSDIAWETQKIPPAFAKRIFTIYLYLIVMQQKIKFQVAV